MSGTLGNSGGARRGAGRAPVIKARNKETGRLHIGGQWVKVRVSISRALGNQVQYFAGNECVAIYKPDPPKHRAG